MTPRSHIEVAFALDAEVAADVALQLLFLKGYISAEVYQTSKLGRVSNESDWREDVD
jgi:hypothetical protein